MFTEPAPYARAWSFNLSPQNANQTGAVNSIMASRAGVGAMSISWPRARVELLFIGAKRFFRTCPLKDRRHLEWLQ
jgi:hypothetical protein